MVPKNMAMYAGYEQALTCLEGATTREKTSILNQAFAGACGGCLEAVVVTPFQLVKVRMAARENVALYRSSFDGFVWPCICIGGSAEISP